MRATCWTLCIALFAIQPLLAQAPAPTDTTETNRLPIIPFLEGTDVFWTVWTGQGETAQQLSGTHTTFPNKLEADIFPHLVVAQNFTDVLNISKQEEKGLRGLKEFAYSISGTPAVRIRMLRDTSDPVRTPSYMPRANVQFLWVRGLKDCDPAKAKAGCRAAPLITQTVPMPSATAMATQPTLAVRSALASLPRLSIWEAHFIIGHHSNGQDGCLSTVQQRNPPKTGPCLPPAIVTAATMNRIDDSFSTNYVRWGVNYSRNWMNGTSDLQAIREARIRVEVEQHPRAWMDPNLTDLYGRTRLNVLGSYAAKGVPFCTKRAEGSAAWTWNPRVVDPVDHNSWTLQASCFPAPNGGWGFFARVFRGQDYYNVGFLDNIRRVHLGMTFNPSGFFRFRVPPTAPQP